MEELVMDTAIPCSQQKQSLPGGDAACFLLSRLPHPDTAAAEDAAFVDAATGRSLSFTALRRGALSLASGLRLGLGLRPGDAVLIILPSPAASNDKEDNPSLLLLPQIVLGVLAAGGVVVAAGPDATPAQISGSGAVIIVAPPELAGKVGGSSGVPLLLTSRSLDPRTLSAEELIEGGDPTALPADEEQPRPSDSDVAFVAHYSPSAGSKKTVAMTHADLIAAVIGLLPGEEGRRRVCLAFCSSVQGLPLLALGLPAAGVTTVLMPSQLCDDPRAARDAVAAHGATDVVATPEAAAVLAAAIPLDDRLSSLRRVFVVAPVPLPAEARLHFRRRLPWVDLTQLVGNQTMPASSSVSSASASQEDLQTPPHAHIVRPPLPVLRQTDAAPLKQNINQPAQHMSMTATPVPTLKKVTNILFGDIFLRSNTTKHLARKEPDTCIPQAASKL